MRKIRTSGLKRGRDLSVPPYSTGSGGFLGWFGLFYSRGLGRFWAYAGNQEDLVLMTQTDGRKIVISPHPPEAFLEAFRETGQSQN